MYKYKVTFLDGSEEIEFESREHIAMIPSVLVTIVGACFVYFDDAQVSINLVDVKDMEINGKIYKLKPYKVMQPYLV